MLFAVIGRRDEGPFVGRHRAFADQTVEIRSFEVFGLETRSAVAGGEHDVPGILGGNILVGG